MFLVHAHCEKDCMGWDFHKVMNIQLYTWSDGKINCIFEDKCRLLIMALKALGKQHYQTQKQC